jgi:uncharacterized protein YukE
MTGRPFASALASFAEEWVGGDIRGLHALATTLYGYLPQITGVITALTQETSRLTGGEHGWRGPAASAFTAAWRRDAVTVETLAVAIAQTAAVIDGLAVKLATIEKALEEQAYTAARYGVTIGTDGRRGTAAGGPASAAAASEHYWARAYRQAYGQAMTDARQARQQAASMLRDMYAAIEGVEGTVPSFPPGIITGSLPAPRCRARP